MLFLNGIDTIILTTTTAIPPNPFSSYVGSILIIKVQFFVSFYNNMGSTIWHKCAKNET